MAQFGYLIHLIADKLWLELVFKKHFPSIPYDKNDLQFYYQDFYILNSKLQEIYNVDNVIAQLLNIEQNMMPSIDELQNCSVEKILKEALNQLKTDQQKINKKLNLLKLKEIIHYLELSTEIILEYIYSTEYYKQHFGHLLDTSSFFS